MKKGWIFSGYSPLWIVLVVWLFPLDGDALAQYVQNYRFSEDLKQYSTELVPESVTGGQKDELVMAGTLYDFNGPDDNVIHFVRMDGAGNLTHSKYIAAIGYSDQRAVDITSDGNGLFYITALGRREINGGRDRILVFQVNDTGMVVSNFEVASSNANEGLYPLHSLFHPNQSLYICGYMTTNSTHFPSEPSFSGYGSKSGFVIQVDPVQQLVSNTFTVSHEYTTPSHNPTRDYDMAMRMVLLSDNGIFLTGSVNGVSWESGQEVYRSSVMNIGLKQDISNAPDWDHPFGGGGEGYLSGDEYGIGMVEGDNHAYILSNRYATRAGSPDFLNSIPVYFDLTQVNPLIGSGNSFEFRNPPDKSRLSFNYYEMAWGLQTLPTNAIPSANVDLPKRFLLVGMEQSDWCGTTITPDDARPFLLDLTLGQDPTNPVDLDFDIHEWVHFWNQTGTGLGASSYLNKGGGLSHWAWNPEFASRLDGSSDVFLSAPKWNPVDSRLNFKGIRVDPNLDYSGCSSSYSKVMSTGCFNNHGFYLSSVTGTDYNPSLPIIKTYGTISTVVTNLSRSTGDYAWLGTTECQDAGGPHYKLGSSRGPEWEGPPIDIFPNPARDVFFVSWPSDMEWSEEVEIELMDNWGRSLGILFSGPFSQVHSAGIPLPSLAAGIYVLRLGATGKWTVYKRLSLGP